VSSLHGSEIPPTRYADEKTIVIGRMPYLAAGFPLVGWKNGR
jgi:hypothetical protein